MALDSAAKPLVPVIGRLIDVNYLYSVTNYHLLTSGMEVVAGEIFNVATTLVGDEPGDPLYGCNLPLYVFEMFTERVEQLIFLDLYTALQRNVPHVTLDLPRSHLFVSKESRIVGIQIAARMGDELFTTEINFGIP